jgi:hypothetical protein
MRSSQSSAYEEFCLVGYNAMYTVDNTNMAAMRVSEADELWLCLI